MAGDWDEKGAQDLMGCGLYALDPVANFFANKISEGAQKARGILYHAMDQEKLRVMTYGHNYWHFEYRLSNPEPKQYHFPVKDYDVK